MRKLIWPLLLLILISFGSIMLTKPAYAGGCNRVCCDVGGALSPYAFRDALSDLVAAANSEHCTPHTLRHTFAHRVVNKHDIRTAAVLLGHKDINTTLIYTFPTEGELLEAVNSLE